jgi:hypothetical protein
VNQALGGWIRSLTHRNKMCTNLFWLAKQKMEIPVRVLWASISINISEFVKSILVNARRNILRDPLPDEDAYEDLTNS